MVTSQPASPDEIGVSDIIAMLECQLVNLDRMKLHIAAAHLDAAIQQLRLELVRDLASE